jgi:hypothetical protein
MRTAAAHSDTSHASPTCSFHSGHGVFDDDAPVGRRSDASRSGQIHFGIRFASVHIFGRNDALKEVGCRQRFQDGIYVRSRRCRSDGLKPSLFV